MTVVEDPPAPTAPERSGPKNDSNAGGGLLFIGMAGLLIALVATVVVIGLVGLLRDDNSGAAAASGPTSIDVSLSEFKIEGDLTATPGDVILNVTNNGTQDHTLAVREVGVETPLLASGKSASLDVGTLAAGTYEVYCTVSGHAEAGMTTSLVVGDGTAAAGGDHGGDHSAGAATIDGAAMDKIMTDSMLAFPAETKGVGNQILEPEILADGTKKFTLTASVIPWEVSPGVIVDAWAYNDQVPGPQIIVEVGDKVQVQLTNNTPMGTDIHWHGILTPNDQDGVSPFTQDPIATGETYTYEFTADHQAIGMYHAHLHSQTSVVNGMFGSFRIGERPYPRGKTVSGVTIPADFQPDVEMPMVLNDAGVIGLSLNGKSFPATAPLVVKKDQWVAVDYYNEGLMAHPMHLHAFPQLVYAKDGIPLDSPYWADTINVAPGERYSVLFQASDVGTWVWHCHILTHAERDTGMFGMVTAIVVQDAEGA